MTQPYIMKVIGLNIEGQDEDFHSDHEGQRMIAEINQNLPQQVWHKFKVMTSCLSCGSDAAI